MNSSKLTTQELKDIRQRKFYKQIFDLEAINNLINWANIVLSWKEKDGDKNKTSVNGHSKTFQK